MHMLGHSEKAYDYTVKIAVKYRLIIVLKLGGEVT